MQASLRHYLSLDDFTADFVFESRAPANRPIRHQGRLQYKQQAYVIDLGYVIMYSDRKTLWAYYPEANEVFTLMAGDWGYGNMIQAALVAYYLPSEKTYEGEESVQGRACYKISFLVRDQRLGYEKMYAWIDKRDHLMRRGSFLDRKKNLQTYELFNFRLNTGLQENHFRFRAEQYPGVRFR